MDGLRVIASLPLSKRYLSSRASSPMSFDESSIIEQMSGDWLTRVGKTLTMPSSTPTVRSQSDRSLSVRCKATSMRQSA